MTGSSEQIQFDLDEWLDSVEGETVEVTAFRGLGPRPGAKADHTPRLCGSCEEMVLLVATEDDEYLGHCPACGRQPGALEMGTSSVEEWQEIPAEEKHV